MLDHRALTKEDVVLWQRILNRRGWATPSWPKEWGGPGWNVVQRYIFFDELHQFPAPEPLSFNVSMIGPVIGTFGSASRRHTCCRASRTSTIGGARAFPSRVPEATWRR